MEEVGVELQADSKAMEQRTPNRLRNGSIEEVSSVRIGAPICFILDHFGVFGLLMALTQSYQHAF